ncbi:DUF1028 domain-containing protein [Cellulomonas sp. APG4]|uniref:DUF1028 domain-containing protein n=1 Tax=Cellulomonas sp. APG4 TaxID=1538656 RepID=UPI00137B0CFC|nr:DUF1028 domain-containing protein [Cellulomonas sp. APG4]NCT90792.1 DUF1028 domain-containing protein [Cellulomonas sp. APG4]
MTYSIVARDADGALGVATASKFLAIGATVPAVAPGLGAVASQGHTNPSLRGQGLDLLRDGRDPTAAVTDLLGLDPEAAQRQVALVGPRGWGAAVTGDACTRPAGHRTGDGWAVIGNLLAAEEVLDAMRDAFLTATGRLDARLLDALRAGERAGGDRRGRQSAALLVLGADDAPSLRRGLRTDLRVDDHPNPVDELARLLGRQHVVLDPPDETLLVPLTDAVAGTVDDLLGSVGLPEGPLPQRLAAWAHLANVEHRLVDGHLDPVLLRELRAAAAERASGGRAEG